MDLQIAKLMFGLVWIKGLAFFLHNFQNKVTNSISYCVLAIVGFWHYKKKDIIQQVLLQKKKKKGCNIYTIASLGCFLL